jgi:hypothetical protein
MSAPVITSNSQTKRPRGESRRRRWIWVLLASVLIGIPAFYAIVFYIYWPFTKQDVISVLQERSLRSVTIAKFHTSYFPPGCVAEGIKFLHIKRKDKPPLITIEKLVITASYGSMLRFERRLDNVRVIGLHVRVPAAEPSGEPSPIMPLTYSNSKSSMPIENLYADRAVLEFDRAKSAAPFGLRIEKLSMHNVGSNTPFTYSVRLYTSEPPGTVESEGTFGPWNPKTPGNTPAHGTFSYQNTNLAFFKQFSGTLSSTGKFAGGLARLQVTGAAQVPNFTLQGTSHKRPLAVTYDTNIDAIHGNVDLTRVLATVDRTGLLITGALTGSEPTGKDLNLDISSDQGRLEDLVDLFISAKQPAMTGDISFLIHAHVPFSGKPFLQAMVLNGEFGIARSQFRDKQLEAGLARLSESTKKGKQEEQENPETVISGLKGDASAANGLAHLSHVEFKIPGAHAWINGTYSLLNYQTNLSGVLITQGDVADTETGFKSILLKALTPFFKHRHHAKIVPFKITGPYGKTQVSLDLGRKDKAANRH